MALLAQRECSSESRRPAACQQELRFCGVRRQREQGGASRSGPQTPHSLALARREVSFRDSTRSARLRGERKALRSAHECKEKRQCGDTPSHSIPLRHRRQPDSFCSFTARAPCESGERGRSQCHSWDVKWKVDERMAGHGDQTRRRRKSQRTSPAQSHETLAHHPQPCDPKRKTGQPELNPGVQGFTMGVEYGVGQTDRSPTQEGGSKPAEPGAEGKIGPGYMPSA